MKIDKLGRFIKVEKDFTGKKIYKLTAIKKIRLRKGKEKAERWYWECLCDCGNIKTISEYAFYSGRTQSCGCAMKGLNAKSFGEASANAHFYRYKLYADKRNIEFYLSREEFDFITSLDCNYCGSPPTERKFYKYINGHVVANGIDRVDSNLDYTLNNCVPCCANCNMAKKSLTVEEFFNLVRKIYLHNKLDKI